MISPVGPVALGRRRGGFGGVRTAFFGVVPLHILTLRMGDAAFSLLVLCLWGEGFSPFSESLCIQNTLFN